MIKKVILIGLLTVGSMALRAQELSAEDKTDLTNTISQFLKHTKNLDFGAIVDMSYPKIFELATKEQMLEILNGLTAMGFELSYDSITSQEPVLVAENDSIKYALINYYSEMVMKITNEELRNEESINLLKLSLANTGGVNSIDYVEERSSLVIKGNKRLLAIKDNSYGPQWTAIEFDVNNAVLNSMLIPTSVLTKISEFIKNN